MKVHTQTVIMKRSCCRGATGPSTCTVDCGPLRLNTSASLQPDKKSRLSPADRAVAKRETSPGTERVRIMCNNGGISGVRCCNNIGQSLQKIRHFNHKTKL